MKKPQIDYDSVAEIYDLYVTANYDVPFFLAETANAKGPVLELFGNYDRSAFEAIQSPVMIWVLEKGNARPSVAADKLRAITRST
jgi:hypothetical protein